MFRSLSMRADGKRSSIDPGLFPEIRNLIWYETKSIDFTRFKRPVRANSRNNTMRASFVGRIDQVAVENAHVNLSDSV